MALNGPWIDYTDNFIELCIMYTSVIYTENDVIEVYFYEIL